MSRTRPDLARLRRRAALGLRLEFLARAAAPACGILLAYIVAALFGFGSPWVAAGVLLLAVALLGFGFSRLRRPEPWAIDRRIEQVSGLRHRPIAMLEDAPENESAMAAAIWQIHQRRIAASLRNARAGGPVIDAVRHDPFALRGLLLLLLLTGFVTAGRDSVPRLADAFAFPAWPFAGPGVNAWITLPAYTGAPPLVLSPGDNPIILAGSALTVIVNGQARRPAANFGEKAVRFNVMAQDSFRADLVLRASARLRIGPWWHKLAAWNVTVVPPEKPQLTMSQPLPVDHKLLIGWHAQDRYGLAALSATLLPVGHPNALPEMFDLPLNSPDLKNASGVGKPDVRDSPYAGLQITLLLSARNLAGVDGIAGPATLRLPLADLQDKTASALAALRQHLALNPRETRPAGDALQKLAMTPNSQISASADLQMAMLARQLSNNEISAEAAQQRMAMLTKQIEQGPDYQPAQALAAANQALEQALRQAITAGKPLDNARLQSLLAAMHEALLRHLQALGPAASPANTPSVNPGDLDQMAEQIAQDQAAGQTAKAEAELKNLEQILAALQSAKPMTAAQAKRAQAANQAAQSLANLMQGESSLLDQTNQGTGLPGTQSALQQQLGAARQNLAKAGIALPGLGDAANAMSTAHDALAKQDISTAITGEGSAVQSLQKAASALASSQGMSFGESAKPEGAEGNYGDGLGGVPDEDSIPGILPSGENAAGAIQRQIIKNDDDPMLPSTVHQYYHRLLDQDGQ